MRTTLNIDDDVLRRLRREASDGAPRFVNPLQ
jgi:hypothetical protein